MLHGSLGIEQVAVRQNPNAGEGFQETHGSHGFFEKLFHTTVTRGRQTLQAGIKKFSEFAVHPCDFPQSHALQEFPANATLCTSVRYRAAYSGEPQPGPAIPALQGIPGRPTGGEIGHHWTAVSALPCGSVCRSGTPRKVWETQNMAPTGANFTALQCTNHQQHAARYGPAQHIRRKTCL